MTKEQIDQLIQINLDKIAPEYIDTIRERLANVDESVATTAFANMKSPTTILILAILLGGWGLDRFMLGQTGLGVIKLLTCGGCYIWTIIDWFTATSRTRKYNAEKILEMI